MPRYKRLEQLFEIKTYIVETDSGATPIQLELIINYVLGTRTTWQDDQKMTQDIMGDTGVWPVSYVLEKLRLAIEREYAAL